ncbi:MAG: DUF1615 domain-containing protein [Burkholderiaceae bacterium]
MPSPAAVRASLQVLLPPKLADRDGWAADIQGAFFALGLPADAERLCAAIAVIEQESSFRADPAVPGLPGMARAEILRRAGQMHVPEMAVNLALRLTSPNGLSWEQRLETVRTERDLSELFEELIAGLPLGGRLLSGYNPVRTGGPMQVSIAWSQAHANARPYPFRGDASIRQEVFTRRGGLYFGIAHLLDYPAAYDRMIYRFADFNAGHHASRNAAFQQAVAGLTGRSLALDGDLVRRTGGADAAPGETEAAVRLLAARLDMTDAQIRRDLEKGEGPGLADTPLYARVFALADARAGKSQPRAVLPNIRLQGPKIQRKLTTAWFAERVDGRRERCLKRVHG